MYLAISIKKIQNKTCHLMVKGQTSFFHNTCLVLLKKPIIVTKCINVLAKEGLINEYKKTIARTRKSNMFPLQNFITTFLHCLTMVILFEYHINAKIVMYLLNLDFKYKLQAT